MPYAVRRFAFINSGSRRKTQGTKNMCQTTRDTLVDLRTKILEALKRDPEFDFRSSLAPEHVADEDVAMHPTKKNTQDFHAWDTHVYSTKDRIHVVIQYLLTKRGGETQCIQIGQYRFYVRLCIYDENRLPDGATITNHKDLGQKERLGGQELLGPINRNTSYMLSFPNRSFGRTVGHVVDLCIRPQQSATVLDMSQSAEKQALVWTILPMPRRRISRSSSRA